MKDPLARERAKYTIEHCSLTATLMHEREAGGEEEEPLALTSSTQSAVIVKVTLPAVVQKELKSLAKLKAKGKHAQVRSQLDEWEEDAVLSADQRRHIDLLLGPGK